MVEKANHIATQRWWLTVADDVTIELAQASLDDWCARRGDLRTRPGLPGGAGAKTTLVTLAAAEPLAPVPAAYPAELTVDRTVSAQALVAVRGNFYSVPPELAGATVTATTRLGTQVLDIATGGGTSRGLIVVARHQLAPPGAGVMVRSNVHVTALESAVLAAAQPGRPHRAKTRIPAGPAGRASAALTETSSTASAVVIDLEHYAAAAASSIQRKGSRSRESSKGMYAAPPRGDRDARPARRSLCRTRPTAPPPSRGSLGNCHGWPQRWPLEPACWPRATRSSPRLRRCPTRSRRPRR